MQHKSYRISDYFQQRPSAAEAKPGVLVTLVHTEGSCYQKAGAQLYLTGNQDVYGLISGGCLEHDIIQQAKEVQFSQKPRLAFFDTGDPLDLDFGYGLGCGGKLWVFLEAIFHDDELADKMICRTRESHAEAIIIEAEQSDIIGRRFSLSKSKAVEDQEANEVLFDLQRCLTSQKLSQIKEYTAQQYFKVALIHRSAQPVLTIFGCGLGSWPLAAMAHTLGWDIQAFDHRQAYLQDLPSQLHGAQLLDWQRPEIFHAQPARPSAAVIMTHNFQADRRILAQILRHPWPYIGLLGSKARSEHLLAEFISDHPDREKSLLNLHAPIGLDLGGTSPEAIALAIVSEIQAVWNQRSHIKARSAISLPPKERAYVRTYS
ncbi:MAG: XdhC family protein [Oligoflexus sp.]